jgi:acetyltransferase-like isoleucine patch superfamily enzyme
MPNKIVGNLFRALRLGCDVAHQAIANSINYSAIAALEEPFHIHYSVDVRTPAQIKILKNCLIKARTILDGRSDLREHGILLGEDTYLKENCYLDAYGGFIEIGGKCAFAQNTIIHGGGGVTIGQHVIVGANCYIIASNHKFDTSELPIMLQGDKRLGIRIGNNVWLGGGVIVLDGVNIGDNCVVGAGSVLTKNVESNTIVYNRRDHIVRRSYDD